jgi:hypothetical protein
MRGRDTVTFEEILDQVMAMLQRRGRVAYRTLKVQFHLDDDALGALKDELIYAQHVAVDEENRVLVWVGGTRTTLASASLSDQTIQPPAIQDDHPQVDRASAVSPTGAVSD